MGDMGSTVLMLALMGAAFYFLLIRPQQKRAKQQTEMTNSLAPGARIMLSSGVIGTIRHLGDRQAIIEIAPGMEMTVIKQAIIKTLKPEDDEFEYSDDDAEPSEPTDLDEPVDPAHVGTHDSPFANPQGANPFDTIEPSDFNDPKPFGSERPATDDGTGPTTQK